MWKLRKTTKLISSLRRSLVAHQYSTASTISNGIKTSVCPKELELFRTLSYTWWDQDGAVKILNGMVGIRLQILVKNLAQAGMVSQEAIQSGRPLQNLNILDAGCGGGFMSEPIAKLGANVTGIDASPDLIRVARDHMEMSPSLKGRLHYVNDIIESFVKDNEEKFDVIVSSEVIEHVLDKDLFASNALRCLRPGGSAFFTTMNRTPISGFYYIFLCENFFGCIPKGAHEYEKFMTTEEMKDMFLKNNCIPTSVDGFTVNAFTLRWFPVKFPHLNYAMHAIKMKH